MGGRSSCFPRRATVQDRGAPIDVVIKIGGSACTEKANFETLNEPALNAVAEQLGALVKEGCSAAIIHGAGSFGHKQARQYGISKGAPEFASAGSKKLCDQLREGFAKTRLSVMKLNRYVLDALVEKGVPAVTISPCPFVGTSAKKLSGSKLPAECVRGARGLLDRCLVPVVHGDAVLDEVQGCAIVSGDIWMVELCQEFRARSAVFITDVDGVFTKPPSEPGAKLIKEILVDLGTGDFELPGVEMTCDGAHDVTGGLKEKLRCAADVLRNAPSVLAVYIVRAGSPAASQALRGETPEAGTTLRRAVRNGRK